MKTQCTNVNEFLSGIDGLRCVSYTTINAVESGISGLTTTLSKFEFSKLNLEHYMPLILKPALKELLGADLEVKLLIMLIGGYLLFAKQLLLNNFFINRIKTLSPKHNEMRIAVYN